MTGPRPLLSRCAGALLASLVAWTAAAQVGGLVAPNVVPVSPTLVTSGQPTRESLAALATQGFEAVIYLAPPTVPDAVAGEGDLLARQGIAYVNIPIAFDRPGDADVDALFEVLERWRGRKVLVHCQVNMRASSLVFLYRVLVLKEPAESAYETVARVWSPRGPWLALLRSQLRRHGVTFEPY